MYSTLKLLQVKPIDKITVRDICDQCELTRNTFYYYFSDIYEVVEELLKFETDKSLSEQQAFDSLYDEYLQKCHIGLNMQSIGASIETVAFPSKISSYMSRGLDVVSGSLESILHSPLAEGITFYQDNSEQSIAKAILMCKRHTCEEQIELIKKAEKEFVEEFQKIV